MCIPRMLWVGKVDLKDGLELPSSATRPSPLGSMGPRAGQVKTRMNYQSWFVCSAPWHKVHPYHMPAKQDINHPQQQCSSRACLGWQQSSLLCSIIIRCMGPPSCASAAPISSYSAPPLGAPRVVLPVPALSLAPMSPACLPPPSRRPSGGMPNSSASLNARFCPNQKFTSLPCPSSTVALAFTAAWAGLKTLISTMAEAVSRLPLRVPRHGGGPQSL